MQIFNFQLAVTSSQFWTYFVIKSSHTHLAPAAMRLAPQKTLKKRKLSLHLQPRNSGLKH
jgi:hypothetical protein